MTRKSINAAALLILLFISSSDALADESTPPADASAGAQRVLNYLKSIQGKKTLAGHHVMYGKMMERDIDYIVKTTGKYPALVEFEGGIFARKYHADYTRIQEEIVQDAIAHWKKGGLVAICWHWGNPLKPVNTYANTKIEFDIEAALKEGTPEHGALIKDLDVTARMLKELRDAGVPVLWRPLHEICGGWFWWGMQGREKAQRLWKFIFRYYRTQHKLNNLIWVYSASHDMRTDWFPGGEYADVIGVDIYRRGQQEARSSHDRMAAIAGGKPVALSECDILPDPDVMKERGFLWSWVTTWHSRYLRKNSPESLKHFYQHELVITRDEMPDLKMSGSARVETYPAPAGATPAPDFQVAVNGRDLFVHNTRVAALATFSFQGRIRVSITAARSFARADIRPLSRRIQTHLQNKTITFELESPCNLSIELDGDIQRPLFLFANPLEKNPPGRDDSGVRFFEGGKIHEAGEITLGSNETLYIAGGAVVRGTVRARDAKNIRIRGRGILDATGRPTKTSLVRFSDCTDVLLEGIVALNSWGWTLVPVKSRDVRFENVKVVGWRDNDDGIDIVGCENLTIDGCFLRTKDDCLAVKASPGYFRGEEGGLQDVRNVRVMNTVLWNAEWGNAVEIGFELQTRMVSNILFRNCDIIHVERGGVFTIHNGDFATVENIRYEEIRVEDGRDKLLDFRVGLSIYSADCPWEFHRKNPNRKQSPGGQWMEIQGEALSAHAAGRGRIRHVRFKDVEVLIPEPPPSYLIGYDDDHGVEDVAFENFRVGGKLIRDSAAANLVVEKAQEIRFESPLR